MAKMAVVIARMRSGTTAFRQVLASNPRISGLGEVFHSNFEDDKFAYYNYFLREVAADPNISLPSPENIEKLLTGYFDYLNGILNLADKGDRVLLMGINYNSLHSLNYFWQNPFSPPHMFALFRKLGTKVLHLRRVNMLETLVSELRARRSGVWHLKTEAEEAPPAVEVNTRTLIADLEERTQEMLLMRRWLAAGKVLELTYEETFLPDNTVAPQVLEKCAAFLDVADEFDALVAYRRTRPPSLRHAIANYDAVADLLSGTEFAGFLPADE